MATRQNPHKTWTAKTGPKSRAAREGASAVRVAWVVTNGVVTNWVASAAVVGGGTPAGAAPAAVRASRATSRAFRAVTVRGASTAPAREAWTATSIGRVAASSGGAAAAREGFWELEDLTGLAIGQVRAQGGCRCARPPHAARGRAQRRSERRLAARGAVACCACATLTPRSRRSGSPWESDWGAAPARRGLVAPMARQAPALYLGEWGRRLPLCRAQPPHLGERERPRGRERPWVLWSSGQPPLGGGWPSPGAPPSPATEVTRPSQVTVAAVLASVSAI